MIDVNAISGAPYETTEQAEYNDTRRDHEQGMKNASQLEVGQYNELLRVLRLFRGMLGFTTLEQRAELGAKIGAKSYEQWQLNKGKTAAILTILADSMGTTLEAMCDELKTVEVPAEVQAERAAIAGG